MEKPTKIVTGVALAAVVLCCGCSKSKNESDMRKTEKSERRPAGPLFVKAKIRRYYNAPEGAPQQESIEITDPAVVRHLASFFPELSKKAKQEAVYGSGGWERMGDILFFRKSGEPLEVTISPALDTYKCTEGKGDYPVRKPREFQTYFHKLFAEQQE